ncbi:CAP domain-containing protein [Streptomyces sp. CB03238]|uniref:CAP domain-containing protein n=1 Tax=Streptomyces sp. CB03238 TaxID=1907777 RepID=UPI001F4DB205|nr:CAP domain-containing protein [Streptomyces sp. CB03238]
MQQHPHHHHEHEARQRPARAARRSRIHQGVGTVIAGTVAAAAVVTGTLMAGDTGGGSEAVRAGTRATPTPIPGRGAGTPRAGGAEALGAASAYAQRVVALTNAERARAGCPPLRVNGRLRSAAQGHADDMAARDYYAHNNPEGRDAGDRMEAAGYDWRTWGENIHRGPRDPARAVRDWLASSGHRENIVNCAFKDIGVGVNLRSNGPWWVQNFGAAG